MKVEIKVRPVSPFMISKRAKRCLAERVLATFDGDRDSKILRIKALRLIAIDEGWHDEHNFGLKACKDWVEEVFANNGAGKIA